MSIKSSKRFLPELRERGLTWFCEEEENYSPCWSAVMMIVHLFIMLLWPDRKTPVHVKERQKDL